MGITEKLLVDKKNAMYVGSKTLTFCKGVFFQLLIKLFIELPSTTDVHLKS